MSPNPDQLEQHLAESIAFIQKRFDKPIATGLVLGSGLGSFADNLKNAVRIPYQDIPHFARSNVEGHAGTLVFAETAPGHAIACMQGRFHYYEGHDLASVVYPIRVMKSLGARHLIVTNAAGGVHPDFKAGDLMLITDHLNLIGENPLRGANLASLGPRFPDMSEAYAPELQQLAFEAAETLGLRLVKGVYAAGSGPAYETKAEVRMLKTLGADAVGMSTVPEVIAANHMGMRVLGISCITNLAAGIATHQLSHQEVLETGERIRPQFIALLETILAKMAQAASKSAVG